MSEKERKDFAFQLLEKDWERRIEEIYKTQQIKPDDVVVICTMKLNREVGELTTTVATKADVSTLKWVTGIGLTLVTIIVSIIAIFK